MTAFSLHKKIILITGASSGIGKSTAILCDKQGATLILLGRNENHLDNIMSMLSNKNHKKLIIDLTDFKSLPNKIHHSIGTCEKLDGIINCAGITLTLPFKVFNPKKLDEIFKINVTSAFYLTKLLLPKLNKKGSSIVFITSIMANLGEKAKSIYSISKGAVSSGAKSLAIEYANKKIRVNTIAPGIVKTEMTKNATYMIDNDLHKKTLEKYPLGFGQPEDVANLCVFLMSNESKWITGSEFVVDGGYSAK